MHERLVVDCLRRFGLTNVAVDTAKDSADALAKIEALSQRGEAYSLCACS
jgi:membrane protein YdbS with pleckstrin-like domain